MFFFKGKSKLIWVAMLIVLVITGIALSKTQGVNAEAAKVSKGELQQYVEDTAQVKSPDEETVYIEGSGKVTVLNVDVGDTVKKGELLLSLDKSALQLKLKDAEAKIAAAQAQLKGAELNAYDTEIELAKTALNRAQVVFTAAQRDYENSKELFASQAISKTELEAAEDKFKQAQADLNKAKIELSNVKKGAPKHVKSGYSAQLEQAIISRDSVLKDLQKQDLRAEMDGVILEKLIAKNAPAAPATPAFMVGNLNNLELEAEILADDIEQVKIGNRVEISGKPIGDQVLIGKVIKLAPIAKNVTSDLGINQKRVPVTILLSQSAKALRPGYRLDVRIITKVYKNVIKVPDSAVFDYQGRSRVFVVENNQAVLREVEKGIESGDFIEIREGLREGETILVKPDNSISAGSKIKPVYISEGSGSLEK